MPDILDHKSVRRVQDVLATHGLSDRVVALTETARSAEDAAAALNVPVGAIVKTLVFTLVADGAETGVVALVSGDRQCDTKALAQAVSSNGKCRRPAAKQVKAMTGFSIGGVSPAALPADLPIVIDQSLERFAEIWSSAGHPYAVFNATFAELTALSGGTVSSTIVV